MGGRSLRTVLLLYVALILTAVFGAGAASYALSHASLKKAVDRRLMSEAAEIVRKRGPVSLNEIAARIAAAEKDHDSADLFFLLLDRSRRRIAGGLRLYHIPPPGFSNFDDSARVSGVSHGRVLTRPLSGGATLVIVSDDMVDRFDARRIDAELTGFGVIVLIVVGGALGIAWEVDARLRAVQRTVDAVIQGDLSSRIPVGGTDSEFDRHAITFNRMLERIDDRMTNIKHSAKDVAHELRSPLARLRNRLGALVRHAAGNPLEAELSETLLDADQLLDLFASLMRLWEIEDGGRRERFADLDLVQLCRDVVETLDAVAEDAGHRLSFTPSSPFIAFRGEANLLRQMLVNLVENAIRHTPAGTAIRVAAGLDSGSGVRLIVEDDGAGIPVAQRQAAIRRFGRLDAVGTVPGQGLGLTLVDAIARLHGGALIFEDVRPGLRAIVHLPLTQ